MFAGHRIHRAERKSRNPDTKKAQPKLGSLNEFNRATRLSGKRLLSNYFRPYESAAEKLN